MKTAASIAQGRNFYNNRSGEFFLDFDIGSSTEGLNDTEVLGPGTGDNWEPMDPVYVPVTQLLFPTDGIDTSVDWQESQKYYNIFSSIDDSSN